MRSPSMTRKKVDKYREKLKGLSHTNYVLETTNDELREIMAYLSKKLNVPKSTMSSEMGYKSYATINKWFNGTDFKTVSTIQKLSEYLLTQLELWQNITNKKNTK